jgi:hypothetical protein
MRGLDSADGFQGSNARLIMDKLEIQQLDLRFKSQVHNWQV